MENRKTSKPSRRSSVSASSGPGGGRSLPAVSAAGGSGSGPGGRRRPGGSGSGGVDDGRGSNGGRSARAGARAGVVGRNSSISLADAGLDEVLQPGAGVELAVDGVDEPGVLGVRIGVLDGLESDEADDGLDVGDVGGVGRHPAKVDGGA